MFCDRTNTEATNGELLPPMSANALFDEINRLPPHERMDLVQRLIGGQSGLTVVLGSNNFTGNNFIVQLGDVQALGDVDPATLLRLLDAIAVRISRD